MESPENVSSSESCKIELTRSSSGASSPSVDLLCGGNAITDKSTGWTNEKHNTFLDCLESSFVKQLRRSMILRAGCVELNKSCRSSSRNLFANNDRGSEQFTVSRDSCWKKINIEDQRILLVRHGNDYHHNIDLQLCSRLHSEGKQTRDKRTASHGLKTRSDMLLPSPAELQRSVGKITEGSGQNFADEGFEENPSSKKMKAVVMNATD